MRRLREPGGSSASPPWSIRRRAGAASRRSSASRLPGLDSDQFAVEASRLRPVTEVLHLTGAPDYQFRVACRDTAELDMLLRALRLPQGAADTETKIVLRSGPPA